MRESPSTEAADIRTERPEPDPEKAGDKELTPLLRQYRDIKAQNPEALLLFRCGDFYETFFEDAVVASRELQITLTARGKHSDQPVPLAGVPYHSVMSYIAKLVQKGFTVAICEQVEDPKTAKGIVKREVVRILTPGTLSDPTLLEENTNNYLAAFAQKNDRFCLASAELSTGEITYVSGDKTEMASLTEEFIRLAPRELLISETRDPDSQAAAEPWRGLNTALHLRKSSEAEAIEALCTLYPQEPRSRFLAFPPLELKALGLLADYLLDTQKCSLAHLKLPQPYALGDGMLLDEATLRNLELLPDLRGQNLGGNLFEVLNRSKTPVGGRLLKRWLLKPLIQAAPILARQEKVTALYGDTLFLAEIRDILDKMPDMERLLAKIVLGGRNPRDLQALGIALDRLPRLYQRVLSSPLAVMAGAFTPIPELSEKLTKQLLDALPMNLTDGGVMADGIDPTLDELRTLMRHGDDWLREYEEKEKNETGIKTLKVRKNSVFGYFIEISKSLSEKAPANYVRKQTLTTGERYITAELKDFESKTFSARDREIALEKELFEKLVEAVRAFIQPIQRAADGVAELDALASLAVLARERGYSKPRINETGNLRIKGGRHPVVEAFLPSSEFVPNDAAFDGEKRLQAIITGPNMAGKSTYLRQTALIVLLAQIGSYVPAEDVELGVVDRIFTRVGASDNLIRGQSTFMVEMMETASILKFATSRSLLVLDEIGRGTSTFDGLALAWAILEQINQMLKARTLFATHYHELTDLTPINPGMFNLNVGVVHDEKTGNMIFLHKILEGPSDKSYGIEVARLAGIPAKVIDRAREILFEMEKSEEDEIRRATRSKRKSPAPVQLSLFNTQSELADTVKNIDIDRLTPLEALNMLSRLKDLANG